jgi:hypothetical protein
MTSSHSEKEAVQSKAADHAIHGALAIANPELAPMQTELSVTAAAKNDERAHRHQTVQLLRERGGEWLVPEEILLALGVERVVRAKKSSEVSLGQRGIIPRELYLRLREAETPEGRGGGVAGKREGKAADNRLSLPMIGGEVRQVLLEILPNGPLRPMDFYVLHVKHTAERGATLRDSLIVLNGEQVRREP